VRTYGQYCAVASALDLIGDRWTLLIVRELLIRQPCRYTDVAQGLPGVATNLLAERLRQLEGRGILTREAAPPPVATTLFRLTELGEALRPVLIELSRWGLPLLGPSPGQAVFRTHWLSLPLESALCHDPAAGPVTIEVRAGDEPLVVEAADGHVRCRSGAARDADLTLSGPPAVIVGLFYGAFDLAGARARGLVVDGDAGLLDRVRPSRA